MEVKHLTKWCKYRIPRATESRSSKWRLLGPWPLVSLQSAPLPWPRPWRLLLACCCSPKGSSSPAPLKTRALWCSSRLLSPGQRALFLEFVSASQTLPDTIQGIWWTSPCCGKSWGNVTLHLDSEGCWDNLLARVLGTLTFLAEEGWVRSYNSCSSGSNGGDSPHTY